MAEHFTVTFSHIGAMAADANYRWLAPFDCTLIHVSAVNSSANAAGINIGTNTDTDEFLAKCSIGTSNIPQEKDWNDFATYSNKAYPRIEDGDIVVIEIDFNYNAAGAPAPSADLTVVLTFLKG